MIFGIPLFAGYCGMKFVELIFRTKEKGYEKAIRDLKKIMKEVKSPVKKSR